MRHRRTDVFARLLDSAVQLRPRLAERARQTEQDRRVSADVTDLLKEAGLYRVVQPRRFGGYELSLEALRRLAFELGQGCASTGWCYGLSAAASWVVGMFPEQAQRDVWGESPDALIASCIAPTGKATPIEGGFRLKGRWSFGSNSDNAQWLSLGAMVEQGEVRRPGQSSCWCRRRTTGSLTHGSRLVLRAPAARTSPSKRKCSSRCIALWPFRRFFEQEAPGADIHDSALYRVPFLSGFPPLLANPAVAALRGALDEFIESIAARATRGAFAGGGA